MDNTLPRKGYARIYVKEPEDVDIAEAILRDSNGFEWSYYPKGLVAVFVGEVELIYTGKYDDTCMDKLAFECMKRGVWIQVFKSHRACFETAIYRATEIEKGLPPEGKYE